MGDLAGLASRCILPGFEGPVAPDWVRRRLAEGLGGVVLYAWNVESPEQLRGLTAELCSEREDVIVAIDEEGGDVTRLEAPTGSSYPGNAALGIVDDVELSERIAASLGAELAAVGVNLDLAPVADVNTNPQNPVIGIRSFGSDADLVGRHVGAFVRGLQNAGVAACAKHFPGHGDTLEDSHLALPVVEALDEQALKPFRAAIEADVKSIMTAHIVVRSLGEIPATMSREILDDLLRGDLGFAGMVVTDALEMKAISDTVGVEEGAVRAIAAGADALCLGHDLFDESVVAVRDALVDAVQSGRLPEERLADAAARAAAVTDLGGVGSVERESGREGARRALRVEGDVRLEGPALVVELVPKAGMAAGRLPHYPGDWFAAAVPGSEVHRYEEAPPDFPATDGRRLVVIARDAHRYGWERSAIEALTSRQPDVIVVEIGLSHWRPPRAATYVATYGAARVNLEAAAEALYSEVATRGGAVR
ncbi:MAG TPA: glycoside hydrolase family 3 protein [Gaiellaceae bacterium]|nr:glycoside hydrolase family 3 protein [Gaiellaceae bacterium]